MWRSFFATQSSSTIHELNARLNLVASGVFAWANLNDMALNTSKTKSILITTQQKFHRLNDHSLNVMINGKLIEQVEHAKLLGVTLDWTHWKYLFNCICSTVHGVIIPIIYCLVFFSFKNAQLDCSLMPTTPVSYTHLTLPTKRIV